MRLTDRRNGIGVQVIQDELDKDCSEWPRGAGSGGGDTPAPGEGRHYPGWVVADPDREDLRFAV